MSKRNENRPGYKKTKVGWIPEEWDECQFWTLCTFGPQNGLYKKQNAYGKGYRMVHMTQLFANNFISDQEMPRVQLTQSEEKNYLLKKGDLLFGRRSLAIEGAGKCSLVHEPSKALTFESSIIRVTPDIGRLDSKYAFYFIESPNGRYQMYKFTRVVAVAGISGSDLKQYRLPVPSLPEQQKIAEILSTWDEAIEQTRNLINAKKRCKKALMQQLLTGKSRLPGFSESWREFQLGDLASVVFSNVDKKATHDEISVRLCNYTDVYYNDRITKDMHLMKATATNTEIEKYKLKKNDVILTKDSETVEDIAVPCYVAEEVEDIVCGYHLAIIRPKPARIHGPFLSNLLTMDQVHYQFTRLANGVTRFGLTNGSIRRIKINIPLLAEQRRIAGVLSIVNHEIEKLETKLSALERQKRGLMQKLLTGQVRVRL